MTNLIKAFAISTAITTTTFAPIQAQAGITTLGECYEAVINWCNETFPDHDCSQTSGLDDCDEEFGNAIGGLDITGIIATKREDETYTLRFEGPSVPEDDKDEGRGSDDDDRDDDREPTRRPTVDPRNPTSAPTRG
ncbi:hypothetical protein SAMN04488005_2661 [Yoonia tamlensis]|uniref:Uncharacterized protein n=1 Tax=Yoonia tamlensis TaxID=390270 RepID=A0A1I6HG57_9RHOB|nr:hypothetical protein [Yoonia tamlensis]SFR53439.1 hypothetical protein SAMN04488005_2661 [Yoonia tamlensis]